MMEGGATERLGWGGAGGRVEGDRSNVAPTVVGRTIASSAIRPSLPVNRGEAGGGRAGAHLTPRIPAKCVRGNCGPATDGGRDCWSGGEHICREERGSNSFPTLRDLISSRGFGKRNQAPERIMI